MKVMVWEFNSSSISSVRTSLSISSRSCFNLRDMKMSVILSRIFIGSVVNSTSSILSSRSVRIWLS